MSNGDLISPYAQDGSETPVADATAAPARSCCGLSKAVMGGLALLVIGAAGVYGAVTVRPELAEYVGFLPGMPAATPTCGAVLSGCGSASECPSACSVASRASCSAMPVACQDLADVVVLSDAVFAEDVSVNSEESSDSAAIEPMFEADVAKPQS